MYEAVSLTEQARNKNPDKCMQLNSIPLGGLSLKSCKGHGVETSQMEPELYQVSNVLPLFLIQVRLDPLARTMTDRSPVTVNRSIN